MAVVFLALLALCAGAHGLVSNAVTDWNKVLQTALASYSIRHQVGLRHFALLHNAQAVTLYSNNLTDPVHPPLLVAGVASHLVLSSLLPDLQNPLFDPLLAEQIAEFSSAQLVDVYKDVAPLVNNQLIARLGDGSQGFINFTASPPNSPPGEYQLTPGQTFYLYPSLGNTSVFWILQRNFDKYPLIFKPHKVLGNRFRSDIRVTYSRGSADFNSNVTKEIADFWADGAGTSQHGGHWNQIAIQLLPENLTLFETSRALAVLNTIAYDANIVTYYLKYKVPFWRPITAIQQGYSRFAARPNWKPYLATPPHPEYPSGHSTTAGAFGQGLIWFLQTNEIDIIVTSEGKSQLTGESLPPRIYTTISSIVREVGLSRVYGGVHFPKAVTDGANIGAAVVKENIRYVFDSYTA